MKSFSWRDQWRYSEAPDRRVKRAMEKDNKRHRDAGKREFNDTVKVILSLSIKSCLFPIVVSFVVFPFPLICPIYPVSLAFSALSRAHWNK